MENTGIQIINYLPEHQPWFEKLNRTWIEKYFWMEPIDVEVLQNPSKHILEPEGKLLIAMYDGEIAGTVALKYVRNGVYEFTKMAVSEKFQGKKIGLALALEAINKAKELGAHSIILYSHTTLKPAIALYRKLGFAEVPLDGIYKRSDIKMWLPLVINHELTIRYATPADASLLVSLGIQTFRETFEEVNTAEDMSLYLNQAFALEQVQQELNENGSAFFIAVESNEPIGYARVRTSKKPDPLSSANPLEIERLYVIRKQLGKQAGKMLMQCCLDYAITRKFDTVWLGVWEHNQRAIRFYEKWGFTKFGSHVFMLGTDRQTDHLMSKRI
jgi:ribosomal protein S18 acetylase RimI-like enzyme